MFSTGSASLVNPKPSEDHDLQRINASLDQFLKMYDKSMFISGYSLSVLTNAKVVFKSCSLFPVRNNRFLGCFLLPNAVSQR